MVALTALVALVIAASGCGGQSSSEVSFRTKANQACRSVARHVFGLPASEQRKPAAGLGLLQESATRLARIHAPAHDARTFDDLITRLHGAAASLKVNTPRVYALDHKFEREMKSFGSPGTNKIPHVNTHLLKRINALARRPLRNIRLAGNDARALKLSACAFGVSSRVSTQLSKSP
ncbi:MAG TPA: hypothetical protein VKB43_05990 [Gaiellaceae bacterium]|nr:hypothetical protein [Gaiellaceae bacterium]